MESKKMKHEKKHKNCTLLVQNIEELTLHLRKQIITVKTFLTTSMAKQIGELSLIGTAKKNLNGLQKYFITKIFVMQ